MSRKLSAEVRFDDDAYFRGALSVLADKKWEMPASWTFI
jgi:hypothetical protein